MIEGAGLDVAAATKMSLLCTVLLASACAPAPSSDITFFLQTDPEFRQLPRGPRRVDAIFAHARETTGSDSAAIDLLGSIAYWEGLDGNHPFETGLSVEGVLAPQDKATHFFLHAMWRYQDRQRLIPVAPLGSVVWEVVGEMKLWLGHGVGFDWRDIWANRLGWAFADRLYDHQHEGGPPVVPSDVIAEADRYRPARVEPQTAATQPGNL